MAKNNNLKDFLTGVAEAIRAKKGTSDLINPQDFESEISGISTEKEEQEKIITVTENGTQEVTPDEGKVLSKVTVVTEIETGGGGDQPVMNAPTISLSGRQLTMTNPSTNGNFFSKFKVFVDGALKSSQTEKTIDLYTYFNEDGTYNLSAKCAGTNFQDSEASNSIRYTKFEPTGAVVWYGNATPLSQARYNLAATTVGNYALFGGGYSSSGYSSVVDAYDESLTRIIPSNLSRARINLSATTVGNYALFGGGMASIGDTYSKVVDAYDLNLTKTIPTELSQGRDYLSATTVGNYALFGGGYYGSRSNVVDAYDQELTRTIATELSKSRSSLSATTVGNYALFGGGYDNGYLSVVDAYDLNLTKTTATGLSKGRESLSSTTVGNYALFGGGYNNSRLSVVDAYDINLAKTIPAELSQGRNYLAATTVGNYALFGGGQSSSSSSNSNVVDVYTVQ